MTATRAREEFNSLLIDIRDIKPDSMAEMESFKKVNKKIKRLLRVACILDNHGFLTLEDELCIGLAYECSQTLTSLEDKLKTVSALERKREKCFKRTWFIVSDKKQVVGFSANPFKVITFVLWHNFLTSIGVEAYTEDAADKKIFFIKGAERTSDYLNMDKDVFIDKTIEILEGLE